MSLVRVSLRKLMKLSMLKKNELVSALRDDIRNDIRKVHEPEAKGGDFHIPFWADAKGHVAGRLDLRVQVEHRIRANDRRGRLYPQLSSGFLTWWEEKRRLKNEPFDLVEDRILGRYVVEGTGVVTVDNLLPLIIGGEHSRAIYPYFSEQPEMTGDIARWGLFVLTNALPMYNIEDLRILDVIRGTAFFAPEIVLTGHEAELVASEYQRIVDLWNELRKEYPE